MRGTPKPIAGVYGDVRVLIAVWVFTRAAMLSNLGYLHPGAHVSFQDVEIFHGWADSIVRTHHLPVGNDWQYPPGAAIVFLLPLLAPGHYADAFVGLALVADLITTVALASIRYPRGRIEATWLWLLAVPTLGGVALIRYDLFPTCVAVVALTLLATRSRARDVAFGSLVGLGIFVKVWPALLLLAIESRRRARPTFVALAATLAVGMVASGLVFGESLSFLHHQGVRGLEFESIAATPWYVRLALTGHGVQLIARNGAFEIVGATADALASYFKVVMLVVALALAGWWLARTRRSDSSGIAGTDAVLTAIVLFVVASPVLSPQYFIWLVGIAAVAIGSPSCRQRRPIASIVAAALLTAVLLMHWTDVIANGTTGAWLLIVRNAFLVFAAVDATATMVRVRLDPPREAHEVSRHLPPAATSRTQESVTS